MKPPIPYPLLITALVLLSLALAAFSMLIGASGGATVPIIVGRLRAHVSQLLAYMARWSAQLPPKAGVLARERVQVAIRGQGRLAIYSRVCAWR